MFDSDLIEDAGRQRVTRRAFLLSGGAAAAGIALWSLRSEPPALSTTAPSGPTPEVTIAEFSSAGVPTGTIRVQKVVKSDAEWKRQLSANAFDITRRADTEMAYTGSYWNFHQQGIYRCICCDTALFLPKPSLIPAPAGQASGSQSRGRMLWSWKTTVGVCGRRSLAPGVMRTWDMSLTMDRRLPGYGTA